MPQMISRRSDLRVVAVRQDNNGDVALVGPALRALAMRAQVTLVHGPSGAGAARLLPAIEQTLEFRADWIEGDARPIDPRAIDDFVSTIDALAFDEAFVFTSFHQSPLPSALLLRLAGVARIHAISVDYPGSLLDTRHRVDDDVHEVERALSLVRAAGYDLPPDDDGSLRFGALPNVRKFGVPPSYVVVQPGASVPARTWSPWRWRAAVAELDRREIGVVVVGSERERELGAFVTGASSAYDLSGTTTFGEFAAIVANASAIVTGNTSGIHVASAVGVPVVTLFPPTIPIARFAPWRVPYVALGEREIACAGCRARQCPFPEHPCLSDVTPDDIVAALRRLEVADVRSSDTEIALAR